MKVYPARVIDTDGFKCRVRLLDEDGLPTGEVLIDIPLVSPNAQQLALIRQCSDMFGTQTDNELDTAARQNVYYNTHSPVEIE